MAKQPAAPSVEKVLAEIFSDCAHCGEKLPYPGWWCDDCDRPLMLFTKTVSPEAVMTQFDIKR